MQQMLCALVYKESAVCGGWQTLSTMTGQTRDRGPESSIQALSRGLAV